MEVIDKTEHYLITKESFLCCGEVMFKYFCKNCQEFMGCYFCQFDYTKPCECKDTDEG